MRKLQTLKIQNLLQDKETKIENNTHKMISRGLKAHRTASPTFKKMSRKRENIVRKTEDHKKKRKNKAVQKNKPIKNQKI